MSMDFAGIFAGRRVLITGHTGFKGSWLATWLHLLGADVSGFALPPAHAEDHFCALRLAGRMRHIEGDLRDEAAIAGAVAAVRPEFVFHLAAQPLVKLSYAEPKLTFDTNIGGGVNLLEAVRHCDSVRALVFITSDKCYRNDERRTGYRESDALGGPDPYSASKACAELVFASYQESYFATAGPFAATARAGNVIGGGDWSQHRIVPDCIRALRAGEPIVVRNPHSVRPWQHVMEPLAGYLELAATLASGRGPDCRGAWNFGPDPEMHRTVRELVDQAIASWGEGVAVNGAAAGGEHEFANLYLDCTRARTHLAWKPQWHFHEAVQRTVEWYRAVHDGADAWEITTGQIRAWERRRITQGKGAAAAAR
ncbi:MAG: CDP-glucose 4,6-dehydratase [Bryobacteraceae bacterium]|jgi:CDP-glucose 4,6-dehydratase